MERIEMNYMKNVDPDVYNAILAEKKRQEEGIELIASENFVSKAVMEAAGSVLTNKYAEGYPQKRYYGGCVNIDIVENLAIERLKEIFGAKYANVQAHSGSQANMGVYVALLERSEEHTSELQSRQYLVCRLLLEKKQYHTVTVCVLQQVAPHAQVDGRPNAVEELVSLGPQHLHISCCAEALDTARRTPRPLACPD